VDERERSSNSRYLMPLAFDFHADDVPLDPLGQIEMHVGRILEEAVRNLGALDAHLLRRALHSRREVHRIPEEAVPRHGLPDHARDRGARREPRAYEQPIAVLRAEGLDQLDRVNREQRHALGGQGREDSVGGTPDDHVGVADGLDLVHLVLLHELVKLRVQIIEHLHHLDRSHVSRHRRETNDVAKEYRHQIELLQHRLAAPELGNGPPRHHLVEEVAMELPLHERRGRE